MSAGSLRNCLCGRPGCSFVVQRGAAAKRQWTQGCPEKKKRQRAQQSASQRRTRRGVYRRHTPTGGRVEGCNCPLCRVVDLTG